MKGVRPRMRPSNPRLGEMTIKVPAPFAGISDLGFTAQYRAQQFNEPQRDIPFLIEGPPAPDAPPGRAAPALERIRVRVIRMERPRDAQRRGRGARVSRPHREGRRP